MAGTPDHDLLAQARLSILAQELLKLDEAIAAAFAGGAPLPWPLSEVFLRLAAAAEICEQVVEHHASGGARVRDITLMEIAATLRKVREVTTALLRIALIAANNQN